MADKFLNVTVVPGKQYLAGEAWTVAGMNAGFNPTISVDAELNDIDNIDLTSPADGDVLKYDLANTQWINGPPKVFGAATAGAAGTVGAVPAPTAGYQDLFLRGDATWANPGGSVTAGQLYLHTRCI